MRGIMTFDDYNYKPYNSYVLVEDPDDQHDTAVDSKKNKKSFSQEPIFV